MDKTKYASIFELMNENKNRAVHELEKNLKYDCTPYLKSILRGNDSLEFEVIFSEVFSQFWEEIELKKFRYNSDSELLYYYKYKYKLKLYDEIKQMSKDRKKVEFENDFYESEYDFWEEKKEKYDMDFVITEGVEPNNFEKLYSGFKRLGAKCQLLVFLKFWMKLSHADIAAYLTNLYEINSEQSSRVQLLRCIRNLSKEV